MLVALSPGAEGAGAGDGAAADASPLAAPLLPPPPTSSPAVALAGSLRMAARRTSAYAAVALLLSVLRPRPASTGANGSAGVPATACHVMLSSNLPDPSCAARSAGAAASSMCSAAAGVRLRSSGAVGYQ